MPVNVELNGKQGSDEYRAAVILKEIFETGLPVNATGDIVIKSNATLYGGTVKDFDIVCIGTLKDCIFNNVNFNMFEHANGKSKNTFNNILKVSNFCFVFEVKGHPIQRLHINGGTLLADYDNTCHDVTSQSEKQKNSLLRILQGQSKILYAPFITNYIWLRGVYNVNATDLVVNGNPNYLSSKFTLLELLELTCKAQAVYKNGSINVLNSWSNSKCSICDIQNVFNRFSKNYDFMGDLTRDKVELITKKILDKQQYAENIGTKLTIISGRAGTGKTIKILRIACDLVTNKFKRCLLLTYNHALVSDMKRMLALAKFTDNIGLPTVDISTIHKYIRELILAFGLENKNRLNKDFIEKYDFYLSALEDYITKGAITYDDIKNLAISRNELVYYDYIFIDESQDWNIKERNILFKIFGYPKFIIADGKDQLVRSKTSCNWPENLDSTQVSQTYEKRSLRQKENLVNFINDYAKIFNINWEMEPDEHFPGGKVIILEDTLNYSVYKECFDECINQGNAAYDILYMVPPHLVDKVKYTVYGEEKVSRSFKYKDKFNENHIKIWDGTSTDLRVEYPVDIEEQRLVQYQSCRGLEGWVAICMELDEFIKVKLEEYDGINDIYKHANALYSKSDLKNEFAYLWSIIPLTRAIDTLVITLKDCNSDYGKKLKSLYEKNKDFIEWI